MLLYFVGYFDIKQGKRNISNEVKFFFKSNSYTVKKNICQTLYGFFWIITYGFHRTNYNEALKSRNSDGTSHGGKQRFISSSPTARQNRLFNYQVFHRMSSFLFGFSPKEAIAKNKNTLTALIHLLRRKSHGFLHKKRNIT